jgi:regulation of enolase protein 1 (concanavalin A-like superfamily)
MPRWMNEPPEWHDSAGILTLRSAPGTDFWRRTMVDKIKNDGHFYYQRVDGDFVALVNVAACYKAQFDQAGLLVWDNDRNWLKCGVEVVYGVWERDYAYRGTAHLIMAGLTTAGWSEWSPLPQLPENPPSVWIRITREEKTLLVDYSLDGTTFSILKVCAFPRAHALRIGRFAACPTGDGFTATFTSFSVSEVRAGAALRA